MKRRLPGTGLSAECRVPSAEWALPRRRRPKAAFLTLLRRFGRDDGAAALEFAFLGPVLVLVAGGIIQLGMIVQTGELASNAAREGARYAAVSDPNAATYASNYLSGMLAGRSDVTVGAISVAAAPVGGAASVTVPVTLAIKLPVMQKILGGGVTLNGHATMRVTQ